MFEEKLLAQKYWSFALEHPFQFRRPKFGFSQECWANYRENLKKLSHLTHLQNNCIFHILAFFLTKSFVNTSFLCHNGARWCHYSGYLLTFLEINMQNLLKLTRNASLWIWKLKILDEIIFNTKSVEMTYFKLHICKSFISEFYFDL